MTLKEVTAEEARYVIEKAGIGADGKVTTAPEETCPECHSERVIWVGVGCLGYLLCVDCGKAGWGKHE